VATKAKRVRGNKKKREAAEKLNKFPPVSEIKAAVRLAMVDLRTICNHAAETGKLESGHRGIANVIMAGILWTNGFAGRSFEWQAMTARDVADAIASSAEFVVATKHKTDEVYGDIGKWLAKGTWDAAAAFLGLPRSEKDLFFDPVSTKAEKVSISYLLKKFGDVYWAGYEPPACNLCRKFFPTVISKDQEVAAEMMARADAHSTKMGNTVYTVSTPEEDSKKSKAAVLAVLGQPVQWPGDDVDPDRTTDDVLARFALSVSSCVEEHEQQEEQAEHEGDDDDDCDDNGDGAATMMPATATETRTVPQPKAWSQTSAAMLLRQHTAAITSPS